MGPAWESFSERVTVELGLQRWRCEENPVGGGNCPGQGREVGSEGLMLSHSGVATT